MDTPLTVNIFVVVITITYSSAIDNSRQERLVFQDSNLTSTTSPTTAGNHPYTLPPVTTTCAKCAGPEFLCEKLYAPSPCSPPNNYCINTVTNHRDGTREVVRGCGNLETCYRKYFLGSSDSDKCQNFNENNIYTLDFECTYCCTKDNCNTPIRPSSDTLYNSS